MVPTLMQEAIIRLSSLGDIIHLALLLPMFEKRERVWFVDEDFAPLLQNSPLIDIVYPIPLRRLIRNSDYKTIYQALVSLRAYMPFDYAIDAQGLIKSAVVTRFLNTKNRYGFSYTSAREKLSAFFYNKHCCIAYSEHILKRNAALLACVYNQHIDTKDMQNFLTHRCDYPPPLLPSQKAMVDIDTILPAENGKPNVLFALEASRASKIYPAAHFLELSHLLPDCSIFLLSHANPQIAAELAAQNPNLHVLPCLNLDLLKALLQKMDIVIGGDTGVVHLAFAFQKSSVMLFSDTPIERFALLSPKNKALSSPHGLQQLQPRIVAECVKELLGM